MFLVFLGTKLIIQHEDGFVNHFFEVFLNIFFVQIICAIRTVFALIDIINDLC